jgi:glycosyltransferase involved in cell wall biosynthesis
VTQRDEMTPENTEFAILSFEGPDLYSMAGGLGVRVTNLSQTLADLGFTVHLFFVGDPRFPGEEPRCNGRLILHRWCQWISHYHPVGVYQGEYGKLHDYNESLPGFIVDKVVKPADARGKLTVVLGEDWHTAEAMCRVNDLLGLQRLRNRAVLFWNANNTFGFNQIDWPRLAGAATITTVSRYMKQIMLGMGLGVFVIPNGIPRDLLADVDEGLTARLRESLDADLVLAKVARWDPDKRWHMAVEATARLKARGLKTVLLARGGIEPHGGEVIQNALHLGLTVKEVHAEGDSLEDSMRAIEGNAGADVISIRSHCTQEFLRVVYRASDAVLANSGHEPFGLVGLETMAAGGIAFTGNTGEDYVLPFHNAIVLETSDPGEIEGYVMYLEAYPTLKENMRKAARATAGLFTWGVSVDNLLQKLKYRARIQSLLGVPRRAAPSQVDTRALKSAWAGRELRLDDEAPVTRGAPAAKRAAAGVDTGRG